jgi:integrase
VEAGAGEGGRKESEKEWLSELLRRGERLVDKSKTEGTIRGYGREWKGFVSFAKVFGFRVFPAETEAIFSYIAWLELQGKGRKARKVCCAIKWEHKRKGVKDNVGDGRIQLALQGVDRVCAGENMDIREPFPMEALKKWVEGKRKFVTVREGRDPAMVAVGMRCMRRPSELCDLKWRHVRKYEGGLKVFLARSKTDQTMEGRWLHMDRVEGSVTCPVGLLEEYMGSRKGAGADDYLFVSAKGTAMSCSAVSSVVKNMVKEAGINVKVSGQSLRIGGATEAVRGGWLMPEICAVGGWKSEAVLRYLRDVGVARNGGSRSMGF